MERIRRSGLLSLFCSLFHFLIGGIIGCIGLLLLLDGEDPPISGLLWVFGNLSMYFIIPILGFGINILQILVIFFGIRKLVLKSLKGQTLLISSLVFLTLNIAIYSFYFSLFYGEVSWIAWGIVIPTLPFLSNPFHLAWFLSAIISTLGIVISLGFLLIRLKGNNTIEGFQLAGFTQLIFIIPFSTQFAFVFDNNAISPIGFTLLGEFLALVSFFALGLGLRKFPAENLK